MSACPPPIQHLSEEALDDVLLGLADPAASAHLAACPACAQRLEVFQTWLTAFNQASSQWAVAQSNAISRELPISRARTPFLPTWSYVAAVLFAVALSFLVGIYRGLQPHQPALETANAPAAVQPAPDRQQEIAGDNALLKAIDSAIDQPVPSPGELYGIGDAASTARSNATRQVRD